MINVTESIAELGKRDLFFLCKEILGYDKMVERVHRPVCNNYVYKTPGLPMEKQDTTKKRLLLDARGHYKTSINLGDKIQWMLCCPDIDMLLLSGSREKTKEMVAEIKTHLTQNSKFRQVYPEFVPPDGMSDFGTTSGFTTPARQKARRHPTLSIGTLGSVKASGHYDIRDGDDVVNEINSRTTGGCLQTIVDWNHTRPLVNPGGYTHLTGTCYSFADLYTQTIESNDKSWKIFRRAAWTVDENGTKHVTFPEQFCTDEAPDTTKDNLDEIRREIKDVMFAAQYLNNPIATEAPKFPLDLLMKQTISRRQMPSDMSMFVVFDFATTDEWESDYTAAAFGGYGRDGSLFIFDLIRGQWNPSQIVQAVIAGARKWPVQRVGIENAAGHVLIAPALYGRMRELGIRLQIDFLKVPRVKDRKAHAIGSLQGLLAQGQLWFAKEMLLLSELYTELTRWPKHRHDDLPDVIAMLEFYRGLAPAQRLQDLPAAVEIGGASGYNPYADLNYGPSPEGDMECLSGGLVG
jgi:predicted phage terminase large subunit-like protein